MKKNIKISIKIKNCDLIFDEALGPGVIANRKLTYDLPEERYNGRFGLHIIETGEKLAMDCLDIIIEEISP